LSILLFNLRKVLKLDGLSLEYGSLHILNHLLLLLSELLVSQLHSVDFLLHCYDFRLSNVRVKGILHFLLKLDLSLPKKYLSLSLDDLSKDISFFLL
jgi:hypothetical protein